MAATLTIHDESATGERLHTLTLDVSAERMTVRDLIRHRVFHEVDDCNRRRPETFRGLIQPTDSERTLNGYRLTRPRTVDRDHRQVDSLDEEIISSRSFRHSIQGRVSKIRDGQR